MAHEIEGQKAFYVTKPAWHGLGTTLGEAPTIESAWSLAYPHTVSALPLSASIEADGETHYQAIETHKAIYRDDGRLLGVVGSGYEVVQPRDCFKFFEPFLESGQCTLEAGGSLKDGKRLWALAKIKGAELEATKGDPVEGYFLVYTSFDGSLAHGIQFCATRVVCQNTLSAAIGESAVGVKIRHTASIHARIDAVQHSVDLAKKQMISSGEMYKVLAKKQVTRKAQEAYIESVLLPKGADREEISTRQSNILEEVNRLLDTQRGIRELPHIKGTAWQAYNAVTDYLTHHYGNSDDARVNSAWFGQNASLNTKALSLAMTM